MLTVLVLQFIRGYYSGGIRYQLLMPFIFNVVNYGRKGLHIISVIVVHHTRFIEVTMFHNLPTLK